MIPILYLDHRLVVCIKPAGISSQADGLGALLCRQLGLNSVYCVHRLDQAVGGVMVYALDRKTAAALSASIAAHDMDKTYLAVVSGFLPEESVLCDLLFHDRVKNKTYVVKRQRAGVKEAVLSYQVQETQGPFSLLQIQLETGRSHQIRVQFASRKLPLLGDRKYGSPYADSPLALWACSLSFPDPDSKERLTFTALPETTFPWNQFQSLTKEVSNAIY